MLRKVSFEGPPPPVPWVCDGVVARGCLTILSGMEGQGKSWLALGLAKGVCEGRIVAGIPCKKGTAMYVDAENGYYEMHRRTKALKLNGECGIFLAEGFNLLENLPGLAHHVYQDKPDLVILDGMRTLWPNGDENDSTSVTNLLSPLRNLLRDANVGGLLLHHLNKTGKYRGSTAIGAEPEIIINMYQKDRTNIRYLKWTKCRVGTMPVNTHSFTIGNGPMGSVILEAL